MKEYIRRLIECFKDAAAPVNAGCLSCRYKGITTRSWVCDDCYAKLHPRLHCIHPDTWPVDGATKAWFALYYEKPVSNLIHTYKYGGIYCMAGFLVELMEPVIASMSPADYDFIVPVPLHPERQIQRGFNQSELLARAVAEKLKIPVRMILERTHATKKQARLSIDRRKTNLRNAFEAQYSCRGLRLLIVDDVLTTGSTVNACAAELFRSGAADVQVLSLCGSRYYRHHAGKTYRISRKK